MGRGVGGCQGDVRYEVILWKKGERSSRTGYTRCSFEQGDLAFQWKLLTSEAFLSASVTGRPGGLERRSWQGSYLWINGRARE